MVLIGSFLSFAMQRKVQKEAVKLSHWFSTQDHTVCMHGGHKALNERQQYFLDAMYHRACRLGPSQSREKTNP